MITIVVLSNNAVGVIEERRGILVKVRLIGPNGSLIPGKWYHSCQVKTTS